jgi:hypothetical protein
LQRLANEEVEASGDAFVLGRWFRAASQANIERAGQRAIPPGRGKYVTTVVARHLKVYEDQRWPEELGDSYPHLSAESYSRREPRNLQEVGQGIRGIDIVVDDEHTELIGIVWIHTLDTWLTSSRGNLRAQ